MILYVLAVYTNWFFKGYIQKEVLFTEFQGTPQLTPFHTSRDVTLNHTLENCDASQLLQKTFAEISQKWTGFWAYA